MTRPAAKEKSHETNCNCPACPPVIGVGVMIQDAEAKRMGEGKTSGVSRGWAIAGIQQC